MLSIFPTTTLEGLLLLKSFRVSYYEQVVLPACFFMLLVLVITIIIFSETELSLQFIFSFYARIPFFFAVITQSLSA